MQSYNIDFKSSGATALTSTNCLASTRMFAGLETSLTTDVVLALVQYKGTIQG